MLRLIAIIAATFIFLLFFIEESDTHQANRAAKERLVIFIPGFKGSRLIDADNREVWVSRLELFFKGSTVALPNSELGIAGPQLRAGAVLDRVVILPYLYGLDIYKSFILNFRAGLEESHNLLVFSYDWRKDLEDISAELDGFVRRAASNGAREINLVGHSFGGLIAAYYLRYGAQPIDNAVETWEGSRQIKKAVFVGAPFKGAPEIFDDMLVGAWTGPDLELLTAEAYSSFPASYQLLPEPGTEIFLPDPRLKFDDVSSWDKYNWGLINNELTAEVRRKRLEYVSRMLKRSARLSQLINSPSDSLANDSSFMNIVGEGRDTATHFVWNLKDPSRNLTKAAFSDGDGIVTRRSAELPPAYSAAESLAVKDLHSKMLSNKETVETIIRFLAG